MRIKGKRERKDSLSHITERRKRPPGRPLKHIAGLETNQRRMSLQALQQHHQAVEVANEMEREKLSTLEKLPVELLQQIFFHALEINLPRASLHLMGVLSTEQIYNALVVFAYFDDDGEGPVETRHFLPAEYRTLTWVEKVRLQESILSCKWATYDRIMSCLPALSRLVMVQAWHKERALDESHKQHTSIIHTDAASIVANDASPEIVVLPELEENAKLESHFVVRSILAEGSSGQWTRHNQSTYLPRIVSWTSKIDDNGIVYKCMSTSITTLACRHIPKKLLTGPEWTQNDINQLQLFRQGYTFIQEEHVMSISADAVFMGMCNAIIQGHSLVLKILLDLHNVLFRSGAVTFLSMIEAPLTPPTRHPIPLQLFHEATKTGDQATVLLSLLIRAGIDSLPRDDEVVTAWALRNAQEGNLTAKWLLDHMEGVSTHGLPRRQHLFVDGCLSWRARGRNLPFPETSFGGELEYLPGLPIVPEIIETQT